MMIGAVVIEPFAATRYLAEPWWASSQRTRLLLTAPPRPGPPPGAPDADGAVRVAPDGGVAVGAPAPAVPPGPPMPDGGPPKPARPGWVGSDSLALAGPASTSLE